VQYPLVEFGSACLFVLVYWAYPFLIHSGAGQLVVDSAEFLRFIHAAVFCSLLLICSVIDLELQIIPDVISLPMIAVSPLVAWLHPELDLRSSPIGIVLGGGIFYAIAWAYVLIRKEYGLGLGDVKLLAAIGGWLGYQAILTTIFWASILGAVIGLAVMLITGQRNLKLKLPFGPFLSFAAILYHLFGRALTDVVIKL
jgi:leader peptidase (prepilin peptidase)/N-methyltransferase